MATFAGCAITGTAGSGYSLTATSSGLTPRHLEQPSRWPSGRPPSWSSPPRRATRPTAWPSAPSRWSRSKTPAATWSPPRRASITLNPSSGALALHHQPAHRLERRGHLRRLRHHRHGRLGLHLERGLDRAERRHLDTTFSLAAGSATQLVFTTSPGNSTNGVAFSAQPVVKVEDSGGNVVTTSSASIFAHPLVGLVGLHHQPAQRVVAGAATFAGCAITGTAGSGYSLTAAVERAERRHLEHLLAGRRVGHPAELHYLAGQLDQRRGLQRPAGRQGRRLRRQRGHHLVGLHHAHPLVGCARPAPTTTLNASSGVATFAGCCPHRHGRLGLHPERGLDRADHGDTSDTFSLAVGSATQLVFTTSPGNSTNGVAFSAQPVVKVEDSGGNVVTSPSASITLASPRAREPWAGARPTH